MAVEDGEDAEADDEQNASEDDDDEGYGDMAERDDDEFTKLVGQMRSRCCLKTAAMHIRFFDELQHVQQTRSGQLCNAFINPLQAQKAQETNRLSIPALLSIFLPANCNAVHSNRPCKPWHMPCTLTSPIDLQMGTLRDGRTWRRAASL